MPTWETCSWTLLPDVGGRYVRLAYYIIRGQGAATESRVRESGEPDLPPEAGDTHQARTHRQTVSPAQVARSTIGRVRHTGHSGRLEAGKLAGLRGPTVLSGFSPNAGRPFPKMGPGGD